VSVPCEGAVGVAVEGRQREGAGAAANVIL
jgi:hypothetical protein